MKIAIVTDAWYPQTNGVVNSLSQTGKCLEQMNHKVIFVTPKPFKTIPLPTYPSIRLALFPKSKVFKTLDDFDPDAIHVATEGPLGMAGRSWAVKRKKKFTTSYHTQFPEYVRLRAPIPVSLTYRFLRWFHGKAERVMVPTESQRKKLVEWRFQNVVIWTRGVDTETFHPAGKSFLSDERPISVYMGRVAVEKNIEAFLQLDLPGTKYVIGDGPDREQLEQKYPEPRYVGFKYGKELVSYLSACDVFVFPSKTDTFGLVLLEAMACGLPVAAYPVTGPIDIVRQGETGVLDKDLGLATKKALELDPARAREYAEVHSWESATSQFFHHLVPNDVDINDMNLENQISSAGG
ncbi:MAG: glycosyltransferase family 1 protein [Granulosicoccus sp.]|nr:glycosyltransferase family 1 protein [Granulosicoccus sp.]